MSRWEAGGRRKGTPADIAGRSLDPGQRRGPGGALVEGPGGNGGRPAGVTYIVAAPWIQRPPGAVDFNLDGTLPAATAANTPAALPGLLFRIPTGKVAVIRSISILANDLLKTSDIRWSLRFNANRVSGWDQLTINPRAAGSVEVSWTPDETFIHVTENAEIDVVVQVFDGGTYQLSAQVHGWYYSQGLYQTAQAAYAG